MSHKTVNIIGADFLRAQKAFATKPTWVSQISSGIHYPPFSAHTKQKQRTVGRLLFETGRARGVWRTARDLLFSTSRETLKIFNVFVYGCCDACCLDQRYL
eukprot:g1070.t1